MSGAGKAGRVGEVPLLLGILLVGAVLRIAAVVLIPSPLESDYLGYWDLARNLVAGHGFVGKDGLPTAHLSLGYPLFLSGIFALTDPSVAAAKAANVLLGVGALALFHVATRQLFGRPAVAAIAAAMFAVYPESIAYTAYLAKENLMIFLLAAQLALATACTGKTGAWRFVNPALFGISTGWMAMVGNAALSLLPGLLFAVLLAGGGLRGLVRYGAIAAVAAGLTVTPLLARNHAAFGAYVINNNGGFNLYLGNHPGATPYFQNIGETPIGDRWKALLAEHGERGTDVMLREMALEHMRKNPGATLRLALRKAVAFWWPPVHDGQYEEGRAQRLVRFAWLVSFCAIVLLFLAGATRLRRFGWPLGVLWLMVAGYTAVHMIFYVIYRYRLPIMPVMCIGAALGLYALLPRRWSAGLDGGWRQARATAAD